MKSFNNKTNEFIETPEKAIKFLAEIEEVCKKYNLSISHEDGHGAFEIEEYSKHNIKWLKSAHINCDIE